MGKPRVATKSSVRTSISATSPSIAAADMVEMLHRPVPKADERAMEEWRQLQAIIGRLEGLEFQIRGWLLVFIGAMVAALLAEKSRLTGRVFGIASAIVLILFCWMELVVRLPKRKAIIRVGIVEEVLRQGMPYDGPAITATLSGHPDRLTKSDKELMGKEVRIDMVYVFYVAVLVIIAVFAWSFR